MTTVLEKLNKWCPPYYKAVWKNNPNEPIRFKIDDPNQSIRTLNMVWAEVLSEMTQSKHIDNGDYIRIHTNFGKHTIAISIYPTGTVMFQGTAVLGWVNRYVVQLCKKVTKIINKLGPVLTQKYSIDTISEKEISIFGLCMLCNKADNDEMLQCEDTGCGAWTHNKCEDLTEEEARKISPYFCPHCRKHQQSLSITPSEKFSSGSTVISAPSPTKTNLEMSSHTDPNCELKTSCLSLKSGHISGKNDNSLVLTHGDSQKRGTKYLSVSLPPQILEDSNDFNETKCQSLYFPNPMNYEILTEKSDFDLNIFKGAHSNKQTTSTPREKKSQSPFSWQYQHYIRCIC